MEPVRPASSAAPDLDAVLRMQAQPGAQSTPQSPVSSPVPAAAAPAGLPPVNRMPWENRYDR
jgi:hypothetical protein